ncbi:hypothetical protein [Nocardia camponoti]|uniref:Uncharacterized protein n=1 Tax=Nocardia camponoti TaxID=1616106 RepID=A0A917QC55_9NOCA|nr:hypothetical protein [Nocardia camponoti]GGK42977.1 hypothetical protein GCM10011591_13310 [Nocardia camponoti]
MKVVFAADPTPEEPDKFPPGYQYPLAQRGVYSVRSMALMGRLLTVLVVDEQGWPKWYPIQLFEIADPRLPESWLFTRRPENVLTAVWGYPSMATDLQHIVELRRRSESALRTFLAESGVAGYDEAAGRFHDF